MDAVQRSRQGCARCEQAAPPAIGLVADTDAGSWPPPAATLLLGIHSWSNVDALRRRQGIRALSPSGGGAVVRFIVPFARSSPANDTLRFELGFPGKSRLLQKYLLANLFLRAAASLGPRFDFVGRSEDDALVDAAATAAHLHKLRARVAGPILYGVKGEWAMWAPATMMPLCWAMTLRRWEVQKTRDETLARDAAARQPPPPRGETLTRDAAAQHPPPPRASNQSATLRPAGECHAANLGPSLLVKGPLVVYSAELLQAVVSARAFDSDEARVRSSWDRIKTERLHLELLQRPTAPRLGVVHAPLAEDVYYATLLGTALSNRSLTFVTVPMSEYAWNTPPSREPTLGRLPSAAVYHRLTPGRLNAWCEVSLLNVKVHSLLNAWASQRLGTERRPASVLVVEAQAAARRRRSRTLSTHACRDEACARSAAMLRPVEDVRSVKLRTLPRIRSRIIIKLTHRGRETGRRASLGEPRASLRLKAFFCVGCCGIQQRRAFFSVSFDVILEGTPEKLCTASYVWC